MRTKASSYTSPVRLVACSLFNSAPQVPLLPFKIHLMHRMCGCATALPLQASGQLSLSPASTWRRTGPRSCSRPHSGRPPCTWHGGCGMVGRGWVPARTLTSWLGIGGGTGTPPLVHALLEAGRHHPEGPSTKPHFRLSDKDLGSTDQLKV